MARHIFDQQPYQTMFKSRSVLVTVLSIQRFRGRSYYLLWLIQGGSSRKGYLFKGSGK